MNGMLTIAIQAGGESRRMGQNKALTPFLGRPLIERVYRRVLPVADEVLVTTNQVEGFEFLGVRLAADLLPGRGALGGLYTAIAAAAQPLVAVVACDMPFINPAVLAAERDLLLANDVDVVIPCSPEGLEPLHAVYRREVCLPAIAAALQEDKKRLISWFPAVRVFEFAAADVLQLDPNFYTFLNINTPDELSAAEVLAQQID